MAVLKILPGRFLLLLMATRTLYAVPSGCTEIEGLYECDYGSVSLPVSETSFTTPVAQRFRLINLNGVLTSNIFDTTFNSIDTAQFDTNWTPTMELKCASNSVLTLGQAAFANMDFIRDIKIVNCGLTVLANTFANLIYLDRLVIENGTINSWDSSSLGGVQIVKFTDPDPSYPVRTGELVIMNSKMANQSFPTGFLTEQGLIVSVVLECVMSQASTPCSSVVMHSSITDENVSLLMSTRRRSHNAENAMGMDLNTLDASMFSNNTKLRFVSLGYNSFTELPADLLNGLNSLAELHLYDTQLDCECSKLWFFDHAETTKLKIRGDITCATPVDWQYYRAASYYQANCVSVPAECSNGIQLMGVCITYIELGMYTVCVCAFILALVVLVLVIHTKRQLKAGPSKKGRSKKPAGAKRRPPKETKKGWA